MPKKTKTKAVSIHNGYLYPFINKCLNFLKYLNLVEGFKYIGQKLTPKNSPNETRIKYSRISVDLFIVLKWLFVISLWMLNVKNHWLVSIVWYLLITNLYTYFYYHTWATEILNDVYFDTDRIKRRFLNLLLSISYSIFGFAYLYSNPYFAEFSWSEGKPTFIQSLWFSVSNSLTANFDQVKPITNLGYSISMIQLLMMFMFLTVIIGGSIPQLGSIRKDG
jgi:hypothetical protein